MALLTCEKAGFLPTFILEAFSLGDSNPMMNIFFLLKEAGFWACNICLCFYVSHPFAVVFSNWIILNKNIPWQCSYRQWKQSRLIIGPFMVFGRSLINWASVLCSIIGPNLTISMGQINHYCLVRVYSLFPTTWLTCRICSGPASDLNSFFHMSFYSLPATERTCFRSELMRHHQ